MNIFIFLLIAAAFVGTMITVGAVYLALYKKVPQGKAMIINNTKKEPTVTFTGAVVIPRLHMKEIMDISVKRVDVSRSGKNGLICKDDMRADVVVTFYISINPVAEDVLKVAKKVGCERASNIATLEELFSAKFSEALKTVGKRFDFEELLTEREKFRSEIIALIGEDLDGYMLNDVAIDYLEQTPMSELDRDNILDSKGIRKISEITAENNLQTTRIREEEETKTKERQVTAAQARMELERQEEESRARINREIAVAKEKERAAAELARIHEEEGIETAKIKQQENLERERINTEREIERTRVNKERDIEIATEDKRRAVETEIVETERKVTIEKMNTEKQVEGEKREIADIRSETVKVERKIATEEEETKDLRSRATAERLKLEKLTAASAEAESKHVAEVRKAAADKEVVKEQAEALKLQEIAKAEVKREHARIDAEAAEDKFKEAELNAEAKIKLAHATEIEFAAEGIAQARVLEEKGKAEAVAIRESLEAIKHADENTRSYEQIRQVLDMMRELQSKEIESNIQISKANAEVMAKAMEKADIQIFSESGDFMNTIKGAMVDSKAAKVKMENHPILKQINGDLTNNNGEMTTGLLNSLGQSANNPLMMMLMMNNPGLLNGMLGQNSNGSATTGKVTTSIKKD